MNNSTKLSSLVFAALSVVALGAHADADPSGQFAAPGGSQAAAVGYQRAPVNPWATSYNPLSQFHSQRTRAEVTNEYLRDRKAVEAMTSEDSGSAYLAQQRATEQTRFAGRRQHPVNAD